MLNDERAMIAALDRCKTLPLIQRVTLYNSLSNALRALVPDAVETAPALSPQLLPADCVHANDYNPNKVASTELELLERSIAEDGFTQPIVVCAAEPRGHFVVVDGFHRWHILTKRFRWAHVPAVVIDKPIGDRMASTVRHNRARGKHQVELMGSLVRGMLDFGWDDSRIAEAMGMSAEELLRLKQVVGVARLLAAPEYGRAWQGRDGDADSADD